LSVDQVVAILATEKNYIASESTGYRILRAAQALHHRRESKKPSTTTKHIPLVVTEPNKVWSWDITWLATEVRGHFCYAYTIIDVFDRSMNKKNLTTLPKDSLPGLPGPFRFPRK